jgi:hypothetical protein
VTASIALAVPWCPWIPERVESMKRLRAALGITAMAMPSSIPDDGYREFTDKAPNDQWSEAVWTWLATSTRADWCLQLQEDALVAPNFWPALAAFLWDLPKSADLVGLQVPHHAAPALARDGVRRFTTADMLIGVGYLVRRTALAEFLSWRDALREGWRTPVPPQGLPSLTEDTMLAVWAMTTGRRIWHPIPTLVDHDTSMRSVWGNDAAANRRSLVTWRDCDLDVKTLEDPRTWNRGPVPHLGRFYDATPAMALRWIPGFTSADYQRARADNGLPEIRRLGHAERGRASFKPLATALLCTPTRGQPHPEHQRTVIQLVRDEAIELLEPVDLLGVRCLSDDLVRTRSRHARAVVEAGVDVAIFLDDDVSCEPGLLRRMVACVMTGGRDIVCAPYPRRQGIDFAAVAAPDPLGRPPESRAYRYNMALLPGVATVEDLLAQVEPDGCVEVEAIPIGCAVIRRSVFDRMIEAYRAELEWLDDFDGAAAPCVALFMLTLEGGKLVGEDFSFLRRARAVGLKVHAYFGPGSPATHHGEHAFRGDLGAFGILRTETPP